MLSEPSSAFWSDTEVQPSSPEQFLKYSGITMLSSPIFLFSKQTFLHFFDWASQKNQSTQKPFLLFQVLKLYLAFKAKAKVNATFSTKVHNNYREVSILLA